MEHNTASIWSLPEEINEIIFNYVPSVADLVRLRSVSKSIQKSLSNQRFWKAICIREFDIEFIDENSNWIELASKYGAITYNIRNARVVVQALAVNSINSSHLYTGESYVLDDNKVIVNWLRTHGRGSSSMDYNDHSAILNITTRKEEQSVKLKNDRNLIVIGDKLAELDWNGYNVKPFYSNITLSDSGRADTFEQTLPTSRSTRTILSNADPDRKHIIVIINPTADDNQADISLSTYDLYDQHIGKTFEIKNFTIRGFYYSTPNVILHGDFIYALNKQTKVLYVFNITSGHAEGEQYQIPIDRQYTTLLGAHKSLLFGLNSNDGDSRELWLYDLHTKKMKIIDNPKMARNAKTMVVHCGVLVVDCGASMNFIDYRSDPNLTVISTLQLDEVHRTSLTSMKDGTLFLSGYASGAKLINFEHANDKCEILSVTRTPKGDKICTPISIKAYELVSRTKELLETHEFISRYVKMTEKQRFGIIYTKVQIRCGPGIRVPTATSKKPEYNTPYMYHRMALAPVELEKQRIVWAVPPGIKEFFGTVIAFYEEFDGKQWRLSKPTNWSVKEFFDE